MWDAFWSSLNASGLANLPLAWALAGLFALAMASATLLPLGSEAAVLALAHTHSDWQLAVWLTATLGNTLGGVITYAMGRGAHRLVRQRVWRANGRRGHALHAGDVATAPHVSQTRADRVAALSRRWLQRHGPLACLLSWLPVVGDPLCAAAGWLRLPFWACALCMALGKAARYALLIALV